MQNFDRQTLKTLADLSRIRCTEEEEESLLHDLREILGYVEVLEELDTEEALICSYVLDELSNVMRDDEIGETLDREEFLANAPSHVGGMIRVPPILGGNA